eukprot:357528-Chlamydomonas_euryale.AAC.3
MRTRHTAAQPRSRTAALRCALHTSICLSSFTRTRYGFTHGTLRMHGGEGCCCKHKYHTAHATPYHTTVCTRTMPRIPVHTQARPAGATARCMHAPAAASRPLPRRTGCCSPHRTPAPRAAGPAAHGAAPSALGRTLNPGEPSPSHAWLPAWLRGISMGSSASGGASTSTSTLSMDKSSAAAEAAATGAARVAAALRASAGRLQNLPRGSVEELLEDAAAAGVDPPHEWLGELYATWQVRGGCSVVAAAPWWLLHGRSCSVVAAPWWLLLRRGCCGTPAPAPCNPVWMP